MSSRLILDDAATAADVLTFCSRAARLSETGVRLQAKDGVLVLTAAPLTPQGLLDQTPTVLAVRVLRADPELICDLVVDSGGIHAVDDPRAVGLPDTAQSPAWAGVSPPRGGWSATGEIAAATLAARAQWGIAAVSEAVPDSPGEDVLRSVRSAVWGAAEPALDDLPLGAAFAAFVMGFIGGEETVPLLSSGNWTRLALRRGHVLVRGPVRRGLTPVRETGTPE